MSEKLPLSASAGGDNTHCVGCEVYGGFRHYAVCLKIITLFKQGSPSWSNPGCNIAIAEGKKACPAYKMRLEEQAAGHAIYYEKRESISPPVKFVEKDPAEISRYDTLWPVAYKMLYGEKDSKQIKVKRDATISKPQTKKTEAAPVSSGNLHADLVNKLMEEGKE
jgi:hypothetical protein